MFSEKTRIFIWFLSMWPRNIGDSLSNGPGPVAQRFPWPTVSPHLAGAPLQEEASERPRGKHEAPPTLPGRGLREAKGPTMQESTSRNKPPRGRRGKRQVPACRSTPTGRCLREASERMSPVQPVFPKGCQPRFSSRAHHVSSRARHVVTCAAHPAAVFERLAVELLRPEVKPIMQIAFGLYVGYFQCPNRFYGHGV
jgi:hypothetical protein